MDRSSRRLRNPRLHIRLLAQLRCLPAGDELPPHAGVGDDDDGHEEEKHRGHGGIDAVVEELGLLRRNFRFALLFGARKFADLQKNDALCAPLFIVQSEQRDRDGADDRAGREQDAVQLEVIRPTIGPWIEESGKPAGRGIHGADVGSFGAIATGAGEGEIGRLGPPTVFPTDDMIDLAAGEQEPLGRQAILAAAAGPGTHLLPQTLTDRLSHARPSIGPWP